MTAIPSTTARVANAQPIDAAHVSALPAVRPADPARHIETDLDQVIDAQLAIAQGSVPSGYEVAVAPHFRVATPFPPHVQDAIRAFRRVPDEMVDIKPNGQIYVSNRHASDIFDDVFGIGGWALVPGQKITERKAMKKGTAAEYEIITFYQTFRAYALGQYVRDVSGAGTYFSNNPEQNFSDAVEAAESYAINRFAKRLGIGSNVRDPIFAAEWVAKYAFQDPADGSKWKKRPGAGAVPLPPSGVRSWAAALVRMFKPIVGEDPEALAETLLKLTTKTWGDDRASRSFRDLSNIEAYDLCRRITAGDLVVPSPIQRPRRASETPQAPQESQPAASPPDSAPGVASLQVCDGGHPGDPCGEDCWLIAAKFAEIEAELDAPVGAAEEPVTVPPPAAGPVKNCPRHGPFSGGLFCPTCMDDGKKGPK
jgi:hypothetical protein